MRLGLKISETLIISTEVKEVSKNTRLCLNWRGATMPEALVGSIPDHDLIFGTMAFDPLLKEMAWGRGI